MSLVNRFTEHIRKENLFSEKDKLLLAVSGGVDSVVLGELCQQAGFEFSIIHCNFQLRGQESERDEQFVRKLGDKYKVAVEVKRFETTKYAEEHKLSVQEAARTLRYEWFEELVVSKKSAVGRLVINPVLTAHHKDDNIETVLMYFFRGTGLQGLTGIPSSNGYIKRPLLPFFKEELLQFASEQQLDFVEDSSNLSIKYTRNFFRNEIIPAISKVYPQVKDNLQDNIDRFKEIEKLYRFTTGELKKKLCKAKGAEWHIPVKQLMQFNNKALIYEIIRDFGFNEKQVDEVIKLASSDSGKFIESPLFHYRLIKHRHWFIISPADDAASATIVIESSDKEVLFEGGIIQVRKFNDIQLSADDRVATLDAADIQFPLLLRKWKTGDYFYPLGMRKKKKLSRFLIDQKMSRTEKENIWVIESNKKILWVIGHRIDERFKITDKTKSVLRLTFKGPE